MSHLVQLRLQSAQNMVVDPTAPLNFAAFAAETGGYSATDLQDLVARAVHNATMRLSQDPQEEDAKVFLTWFSIRLEFNSMHIVVVFDSGRFQGCSRRICPFVSKRHILTALKRRVERCRR